MLSRLYTLVFGPSEPIGNDFVAIPGNNTATASSTAAMIRASEPTSDGSTTPANTTPTTTEQDPVEEMLNSLNDVKKELWNKSLDWEEKQLELLADSSVENPAHEDTPNDQPAPKKWWNEMFESVSALVTPEEKEVADAFQKAEAHVDECCQQSIALMNKLSMEDSEKEKKVIKLKICEVNLEILNDLAQLLEDISNHIKSAIRHKGCYVWIAQNGLDLAVLLLTKTTLPQIDLSGLEKTMGRELVGRLKAGELMERVREWEKKELAETDFAAKKTPVLPSAAASATASTSSSSSASASTSVFSKWHSPDHDKKVEALKTVGNTNDSNTVVVAKSAANGR